MAARRVLLRNNAAKGNNWLGVKLEGVQMQSRCDRRQHLSGRRAARNAIGLKNNGGSYLSSHDPREVLGIGTATKIDELEIHWPAPSKQVEKLTSSPPIVTFTSWKGRVWSKAKKL